MNLRYPWRMYLLLWVCAVSFGQLCIPYVQRIRAIGSHADPYPSEIWYATAISNGVVYAVVVGLGLLVAPRVRLGAPYLTRWLYGTTPARPISEAMRPAIVLAVVASVVAMTVDLFFVHAFGVNYPAPEVHARIPGVEAWRGVPVAFCAGLNEELFHRLFLMSSFAWIISRVLRADTGMRRSVALWSANAAACVLFAWLHLKGLKPFGPADGIVLVRSALIVTVPSLVFGSLYWKRGLESAIVCHFLVDIIVHVARPLAEEGF